MKFFACIVTHSLNDKPSFAKAECKSAFSDTSKIATTFPDELLDILFCDICHISDMPGQEQFIHRHDRASFANDFTHFYFQFYTWGLDIGCPSGNNFRAGKLAVVRVAASGKLGTAPKLRVVAAAFLAVRNFIGPWQTGHSGIRSGLATIWAEHLPDGPAWAMHMSRVAVAKASFSFSSANEVGTNMSGPSAPIRKRGGAIFPLLRIQNSA